MTTTIIVMIADSQKVFMVMIIYYIINLLKGIFLQVTIIITVTIVITAVITTIIKFK